MKLIYSLLTLFFIFSPLYAENYRSVLGQVTDHESEIGLLAKKSASILGKVTDEKSGAGIPGIKVSLGNRKSHTDNNGIFTFNNIEPDKFYTLTFYAPHPYCPMSNVDAYILDGENIVNLTLGNLGSCKGKVYKSRGTPLSNAEVTIWRPISRRKSCYTREDGSYSVEGLCSGQDPQSGYNYYMIVSHKIPGLSFRYRKGIKIKSGECTYIKDIFFDTADDTGIEGYVTSALDGEPLPGVKILLRFYLYGKIHNGYIAYGSVRTDSEGYFYLRNINPPGLYLIETWLPTRPLPKYHHSGEDVYTFDDYVRNKKKIKVKVRKGELFRLSISLDVPSYTGHWPGKMQQYFHPAGEVIKGEKRVSYKLLMYLWRKQ